MAIDLATEVTSPPSRAASWSGSRATSFRSPRDHAGRGTAPVRAAAALAAGLLRTQPPPSGGVARVTSTMPVGAGLSSSAAFSVALLLALGHDPDPLALARDCQEAERGRGARRVARSPGHRRRQAGHALRIDFATLRDPPGAVPDEAAFVIVHSEAPAELGTISPYATRRAECERAANHILGRPLGLCDAGRPQRADRSGAAPAGPSRDHRVRPGPGGRTPAGPGQPGGRGRRHDRGHRSLAGTTGSRPGRRRIGRAPAPQPGRPGCPHERRRLRRVRHRAVPARLPGARPRDNTPRAGAGGSARLPAQLVLGRSDQRIEHASARPLSMDSVASPSPLARSSTRPGHHEAGGGVEDPMSPGAPARHRARSGSRRR
jgi:hypothetical protein